MALGLLPWHQGNLCCPDSARGGVIGELTHQNARLEGKTDSQAQTFGKNRAILRNLHLLILLAPFTVRDATDFTATLSHIAPQQGNKSIGSEKIKAKQSKAGSRAQQLRIC